LLLFGASGLLLGPLVLTVTMFFLEIWRVPVSGSDAD
jgi:predicted PurR-regulated permease PerM